jgi:serine/threonine-protein kinase
MALAVPWSERHTVGQAASQREQPYVEPTEGGQRLPADTLIGERYRVVEALGEGMSGVVYRARQESLDRDVAVKVLHPERSHDPTFVDRFRAEARIASAISDPHITAIYDFGEHDGCLYLVMELVTGHPLGTEMDRGVADTARVRDLMVQILDGLAAIHKANVVHADLKPDNVIIARTQYSPERVVLIDFGIARLQARTSGSERRITKEEFVAGTPGYIAPEVITGETPSPSADLYAAGVILFELLTGAPLFTSATGGIDLVRQHVCEPSPAPSSRREGLPPGCDELCRRALAKSPAERFSSAEEFRAAIERVIGPDLIDVGRAATVERAPRSFRPLPFVGRLDEQRALVELFEGTGTHQAMRLDGAGGSGRTRLVDNAATRAKAAAARVVRTSADPSGCRSLYYPIRGLLARIYGLDTDHSAGGLAMAVGANLGPTPELAALCEMLDGSGHLDSLTALERRELVLYSVVSIVERAMDGRTTLVFDDAYAYDEASREIVAALARRVPAAGGRLLVVTEPQDDLLRSLPRIELGPLSEGALAEIARVIGEQSDGPPSVAALLRLGGCHPAHLEQIARHLIEVDGTPPSSFFDLVRSRLTTLPAEVVALLETLSVVGRGMRRADVAAVARAGCAGGFDWSTPESVDAALEQAMQCGMLALCDGEVRFVCSAVRDAVYATIPAWNRVARHALLLDCPAADVSSEASAWHAIEGERTGDAARHLVDAAARSARFFDRGAALQHYRGAFEAARRFHRSAANGESAALLERAGVGLATAYIDHGLAEAATAVLGVLGTSDVAGHSREWSTAVIEAWARLAFLRGDTTDAVHALAEQMRDSATRIESRTYVAWAQCLGEFQCVLSGPETAARMLRAAARELQARDPDSGPSWRLLLQAADYHASVGNLTAAIECAVSACAEASGTDDHAARWRTRMTLALAVEARGGDHDGARHRRHAASAFGAE